MHSKKHNYKYLAGLFLFSFLLTLSIVFAMKSKKNTSQDLRGSAQAPKLILPTSNPTQEYIIDEDINVITLAPTSSITEIQTTSPDQELPITERNTLYKEINWPAECEEAFNKTSLQVNPNSGGIFLYELNTNEFIAEIICGTGAYQPTKHFYYYNESTSPPTIAIQSFKEIDLKASAGFMLTDKQNTIVSGTTTFNKETRNLEILHKDRGLGDCGYLTKYNFNNNTFELTEVRVKPECDDRYVEPKDWRLEYLR